MNTILNQILNGKLTERTTHIIRHEITKPRRSSRTIAGKKVDTRHIINFIFDDIPYLVKDGEFFNSLMTDLAGILKEQPTNVRNWLFTVWGNLINRGIVKIR